MRRSALILILLGLIMAVFAVMPVAAVTEHCPDGWTSKDETGNDGDLVLAAGTVFCVKGGTEATGILVADGETSLSEYLVAAGIAGGESYFAVYPPLPSGSVPPPPSESVPPPPSESVPPPPSESIPPPPSEEPPGGIQFSVSTCPTAETASTDFFAGINALVIPDGMSAIRFSVVRAALVITNFTVRIDGVVLTLENTLGDGTVGDRVVTPGLHTWSISNAEDTEVLAEGEILCPVCNADAPPPATTPDVPDTAMLPMVQGVAFVVGLILMAMGGLVLVNARSRRSRL